MWSWSVSLGEVLITIGLLGVAFGLLAIAIEIGDAVVGVQGTINVATKRAEALTDKAILHGKQLVDRLRPGERVQYDAQGRPYQFGKW